MFSKKTITVGIDGNYSTLKEAFNHHKRGRVCIVLTSDVLDEEDIEIPPTLNFVHIKTKDNNQRIFCKEYMTIYCHGVSVTIESIGKSGADICIVGTQNKTKNVSIELKQCKVDYVIGVMDVEEVKRVCIKLDKCEAYVVTGVFSHNKPFDCECLEMQMVQSEINTLQGLNIGDYRYGVMQEGKIVLNSSIVKEVNLVKSDRRKESKYPLKLIMTGESTVIKQIT